MGQATALAIRERIVELRGQGYTIQSISDELSLSYSTTKKLYRRYRERGATGLLPDYSNCGSKTGQRLKDLKNECLSQKGRHPKWGSPGIRVALRLSASPQEVQTSATKPPLPSIRTLQRWYRSSGLSKPPHQSGEPSIGRSTAPHNIWEVDAKENLVLTDGRPACYLTIGDEKTGAWLEALVFPPPKD